MIGSFAGMALLGSQMDDNAGGALLIGSLLGGAAGGIVGFHSSSNPTAPTAALFTPRGGRLGLGVPAIQPHQRADGRLDGATLTLLGARF